MNLHEFLDVTLPGQALSRQRDMHLPTLGQVLTEEELIKRFTVPATCLLLH